MALPRYLISFDAGAMVVPDDDLPAVAEAAHEVVRAQKADGVWVFSGGLMSSPATVVATDGTTTDGPWPETKAVVGGFTIVEVSSHEEAVHWAGKLAAACRCAHEVREIMHDPLV